MSFVDGYAQPIPLYRNETARIKANDAKDDESWNDANIWKFPKSKHEHEYEHTYYLIIRLVQLR